MDNKNSCLGFFSNGKVYSSRHAIDLSKTWSYHNCLKTNNNIEYGKIYAKGLTLGQVCPEYLKNDWKNINIEKNKFIKTFNISKVDLLENCFYDLVPEFFINDYFSLIEEITKYTFNNYNKPSNHNFLVDLWKLTTDLSYNKLNFNTSININNKSYNNNYIKYNIFGTITGRLSTNKDSFPILQFDKKYRKYLTPKNDLFLIIDFNAAEFRTILSCSGKSQPSEDLLLHFQKKLKLSTREETKKEVYSWFYNINKQNKVLENFIDKNLVLKKYYKNNKVINSFGREIECDRWHALNYLIQSEFSDTFQENVIKLHKKLQNKKSFVNFVVHDELVLDVDKSEIEEILILLKEFSNTRHGKFRTKLQVGLNYGETKLWKIL